MTPGGKGDDDQGTARRDVNLSAKPHGAVNLFAQLHDRHRSLFEQRRDVADLLRHAGLLTAKGPLAPPKIPALTRARARDWPRNTK